MALALRVTVLCCLLSAALASPLDIPDARWYYKKPLSSISPDDIRGPGGEVISGQYAAVPPKVKWAKGELFWEYDPANNFTAVEKATIEKAFAEIQNATCIKIKKRTTEVGYVNVKNDVAGCWAEYGYLGRKQDLNMAFDCFGDTATMIHEVMHALGFDHEQTRYDRDMYIEVQWENVDPTKANNFEKYPRTRAYPRFPYDLFSVMQYFLTAFGTGGRPTMVLTFQNSSINEYDIGTAKVMSKSDILRMRSAYKCDFSGENSGASRSGVPVKESAFAKYNFF